MQWYIIQLIKSKSEIAELNILLNEQFIHTSDMDKIPKPFGPNPSSIFEDKSTFFSYFNQFQKKQIILSRRYTCTNSRTGLI